MCVLRVSGFYMGKLRGLFGDGNNEPYDDFTLPSGKVRKNILKTDILKFQTKSNGKVLMIYD